MLAEVRDCDLLIVATSSTFLKRKDMLKAKSSQPRSSKPAAQHIYRHMYCVHLYGLHVYCALVDLGSSGSPGVRTTPGLTSSTQVVCLCVCAYTSTHTVRRDWARQPERKMSRVTKRKCPARWQVWLQRQEGLQLESGVLAVWMWQAWLQRQEGLQRESGVLTVWMARGATWS
jgi:hypothetical protein